MKNSGYEFALSYSGTVSTNKVWSVALNGRTARTLSGSLRARRVRRSGGPQFASATPSSASRWAGGGVLQQVANSYYLTAAEAADHRTTRGTCHAALSDGAGGPHQVADVNGDGFITTDRTVIGGPHPDFTGGLTSASVWGPGTSARPLWLVQRRHLRCQRTSTCSATSRPPS
jgi:hypothetical protein